eukprot:CAMPEP_0113477992 /NCGR_PEP_ID=MMETSP0014_2-20120614/20502_1 /TAXON_ID=2857 /ORGANISM="Nitzschia sp." /LENGTH=794 /DNA_ID=CAMNT_0000371121 /DNA_START=11 /DNA_END=2393 /DNA_ORIENTATION=- /assembly_acc=CAM_ASM_000159
MDKATDMDAEKVDAPDKREEVEDDRGKSSKKQRIERNSTEEDGSPEEQPSVEDLLRQINELNKANTEKDQAVKKANKEKEEAVKKANKEKEEAVKKAKKEKEEAVKKAKKEEKEKEEAVKKIEEKEEEVKKANKEKEEFRKEAEEAVKKANKEAKEKEEVDILISVEGILEALPRMDPNPSCAPSITPNLTAQEIVTKYRSDYAKYVADHKETKGGSSGSKSDEKNHPKPPEKFKFHEPAKIKTQEIDPALFDFDINIFRPDRFRVKSALAMEMSRECRTSLQHHNEVSPRDAFVMVIKDVVECSQIPGISVVKEATLFSLRPDLVVVVVNGYILFVCEIKNPSDKDHDVFTSETAAAQALDYAFVNQQNGMDWPFVILSTYNHSVIATLSTPDDDQKYQEILAEGFKNAKQIPSERAGSTNQTPQKKPSAPSKSPSQDNMLGWKLGVIDQTIASKVDNEQEEETNEEKSTVENTTLSESGYDYRGREVVFSQTFDHTMNYKLVDLVLESALVASAHSKISDKPLIPKEGASLKRQYCTLTETGFSWEPVNIESVTYNKAPSIRKMKKYHVLCQLDQGGSGKTILCCSSGGKAFSVKLFFVPPSTRYKEDDRKEEEAKAFDQKWKEAEEECRRWHLLAPEFKSFCHVIKLNGQPAVTMPYFQPIPFDKRDDSIDLVYRKLTEAGTVGLYYREDEMRWGHCGCRWIDEENIRVTLLDLGSLHKKEVCQGKDVDVDMLRLQKESLLKGSGKEEISDPKTVFVDEVKSSSKVPKPWHRITAIPYGVGRRSTIKSSIG